MPRCDRCRYFHAYPTADRPNQIVRSAEGLRGCGECRIHPPVFRTREAFGQFPVVVAHYWCGQFEESTTE